MTLPYLIQGTNIVINVGTKVHTINKTHIAYDKILDAIKSGDWQTVTDHIEPKKVIVDYGSGNISMKGDEFYWKDVLLDNSITRRIIKMYTDGFDIEPMVKFMDNLMQNPSNTAVNELYLFLEGNMLPITPDGHFLAYKKVTDEFKDFYSGEFDNSIGQVVTMERNMVDDNRGHTCSHGLHFSSYSYARDFHSDKGRIVILKINPCDVVSIPYDYNNQKGRCSRYEVVSEYGVENIEYTSVVEITINDDVDLWNPMND
jgi:hypothetical protein